MTPTHTDNTAPMDYVSLFCVLGSATISEEQKATISCLKCTLRFDDMLRNRITI
jgi:hypothetical protein